MMNEWASKLLSPLSVFPDRGKADFDQFMVEVNNDQAEQMYYNRELDEDQECRPTFDQLSMERIVEEAQKNIQSLKSLETIVSERLAGFTAFNTSLLKARTAFEGFETNEQGTLKLATDAFYIFSEQELASSKQQLFLGDLKRSLNEVRHDAQRKLAEYQKELATADKDVATAEKKLTKTREAQERGVDLRSKMEAFELEALLNVRLPTKNKDKNDRNREVDDLKLERELKEDIRGLLGVIAKRDQVLSASRRAFQNLNKECKRTMYYTLRKILEKEKDSLQTKQMVIEKFESNVSAVNVEADVNDFIENSRREDTGLILSSRALSLLEDLGSQQQQQGVGGGSMSPVVAPSSSAAVPSPSRSNSMSASLSRVTSFRLDNNANANGMNSIVANNSSSSSSAVAVPMKVAVSTSAQWEYAAYLSQIFYDSTEITHSVPNITSSRSRDSAEVTTTVEGAAEAVEKASSRPASMAPMNSVELEEASKSVHRKARVSNHTLEYHDIKTLNALEITRIESNKALSDSVEWLCRAAQTQKGRDAFVTELNQFRSRKVELGNGFDALGIVLWRTLTVCQEQNDIHTAKVVMMLSQTFYRLRIREDRGRDDDDDNDKAGDNKSGSKADGRPDSQDLDGDDGESPKRGVEFRQYIKERLMGHPLWEDGNFWEQVLWQCTIEQLQTIPYERPWYDMDREGRALSVRRVHDVVFSQVMAIVHSMIELGVTQKQTREFLYRMCVIHQLSEAQRQQLLGMVLKR